MTYGEHIHNLARLISAIEVAQDSAAHSGMTAAAFTINQARKELIRDIEAARNYADEHMAHGQEIA